MDFDTKAKTWDNDRRVTRARIIADEIRSHIIDGKHKSAMEYGCGTGLVGLQLSEAFASLLFMDSSQGIIDELNRKICDVQNVSAVCFNLITKEKSDYHFDCIFSSMVLHHIPDTEAILSSFFRLLNKGGCLLIVDLDQEDGSFHAAEVGFQGHNGFDQTQFKDILEKVGFHTVEIKTFYRDQREINGIHIPYSLFILRAEK